MTELISDVAFKELATGLAFPEGPIALPDGDVLVVEIFGGTLTRITPDGRVQVVARVGGGPNGAAIGPDGKVYICNNGGFDHAPRSRPGLQPPDYKGGSIQRVDLASGAVETLYTHCGDISLRAPNDLVFDAHGGFYFTDYGQEREREADVTGVFYAKWDGSAIRQAVFPLNRPNGVGLSPDSRTLYVSETWCARLWAFDLAAPGVIKMPEKASGGLDPFGHGGRIMTIAPKLSLYDSLAVDGAGNVCVATLLDGGITVVSPAGERSHVALPDIAVTNICFGGADLRTAFVTLSGSGRLISFTWPRSGLKLAY